MIDLHMHSIFSDGTQTPEDLVKEALRQNLSAVALTDHDTVKGVPRFLKAGKAAGIRALAGVEVSTSYSPGEMHVLGYCIDHRDAFFATQLEWIRRARQSRNEEILHKLHGLGMHLNWEEIRSFAGDQVIGRPHFAQAMVARGYVRNTKEAFSRWLARGCPAYARRRTVSPEEALEIIRDAGGVPVLAHPFTLNANRVELRRVIHDLKDMGLGGIEAYYPQHGADQTREYLKLAGDFGLVPTGGTDFHGAMTPDLTMGRGFGSLRVPDDIVDRLLAQKMRACRPPPTEH